MSAHAKFSPSASDRWLNCTAAPLMEVGLPDTSSDAADKGTCYHEIAEIMLRRLTTPVQAAARVTKTELKRALMFAFQAVLEDGTSSVNSGDAARLIDIEEAETMSLAYVAHILKKYGKEIARGAAFGIEGKSKISEDLWGTVDFWAVIGKTLHIVDLKTGRFPVSPENNSQLLTYAVGFLSRGFKKVNLVVFQDGYAHEWEANKDLVKYHREAIDFAVFEGLSGGTQKAGSHCKWCKAKAVCPAFAAKATEVAASEFAQVAKVDPAEATVETLSGEEAAKMLEAYQNIEAFISAALPVLARRAYKEGLEVPGYKVIRGTKHKAWEDKEAAGKALGDKGFKPQLLTPNQAIKALGKEACSGLWSVPTGEVKLVTVATRGKAVEESAENDFQD